MGNHRKSSAIRLWVTQGLLAALFCFAGAMKFIMPLAAMNLPLPVTFLRFIGVAEILGALGLVLPGLTNVARGSKFGEAEVENLGVIILGDEDVGRLDVAMDDSFGVRGVKGVGDFDGEFKNFVEFECAGGDAVRSRDRRGTRWPAR